ncbi:MAG: isocitrate lyase/PEP mutase family protein [Lachnospiraceae bacterium]|nr:isocitrate lyase/PEP mutase family protein [Lachnospiraceae bacterium]
MKHQNAAKRFREMLAKPGILVCPNCYDALSARMIEDAGFPATFISGAALTNAKIGQPDVGITTYTEYRNAIQEVLFAVDFPVLADVDTGYGGTMPIYRMTREYEEMGVAGIQIEDQTFPKRCAFFGTSVVSADEMCRRIRAVREAQTNPDFFVIARTDAASSLGLDEALRRLELYRDAGADMLFVSAPPSEEALEKMLRLGLPLCVTVIEGTPTEKKTAPELERMGFKIVRFPQTLIRARMKAEQDILQCIRETGGTWEMRDRFVTQAERSRVTGLEALNEFEKGIG